MKTSLKRLVTGLSVVGLGASVALPSMAQSKFTPNAETTPANTPQTPAPTNRDAGIPPVGGQQPGQFSGDQNGSSTTPVGGQSGQNTPGSITNPDSSVDSGKTTAPGLPNNQSVPGTVAPANRPEVNNTPTNSSPTGTTPTGNTNSASTGSSDQSIDQIVRTSPSFELFNALLRVADSNGAFSSNLSGDVTVFAPTDEALAAIPPATFKALVQPENRALLSQVLQNHIVKGKVSSSDLAAKQVQSLGGNPIAAQGSNGMLMIGNAQVVGADIAASNGTIHAINQVILPASLQGKLTSLAPTGMPMTQP
ncbi:fasciclin domain-containing protein [Leptolyngbya sp. FACHB-17]|uniref:fasciclin domain-containing protein n=1 Tax=unclassified Leptolyngbya TaxID=2650499 RepID=UPI001680D3CF|nr:fasciclin domain-containing protein [Leptolyngbya sp. FACHB-17]MBD2079191.1 fasciclin domain-containing protein [Leptolyngbya sp. FACHB-17]